MFGDPFEFRVYAYPYRPKPLGFRVQDLFGFDLGRFSPRPQKRLLSSPSGKSLSSLGDLAAVECYSGVYSWSHEAKMKMTNDNMFHLSLF